ncbi:MAG: division/outer membrane stress-associated lipid-binding lipoprotein [Granulosicoccaceae bacterium]|jgi:osmotically-inducible protein OsmY
MKPIIRTASLLCVLATAVSLQGCAEMVVGGAAAGATVAHDRRTAGTFVDDELIELKAARKLSDDKELAEQAHINVTSYNNIILLSGEVPNETLRTRAADLVRPIPKVRQVHNELVIAAPSSLLTRTSDGWITTKVKTSLFSIKNMPGFDPTRVKVVSENGTVFLMGIVRRVEADAATDVARRVAGVQRVVKLFEYLD